MSERGPELVSEQAHPAPAAEVPKAKVTLPRLRLIAMLSVPLLLIAIGTYWWLGSGRYVSTDDAYVAQDMVTVAPEVGGRLVNVFVRENQRVSRGDLLFQIDARPYRIALEQADAQIAGARVQVKELATKETSTAPDIKGALANLGYAQRMFDREAALLEQGFATRASYDAALQTVREARQRFDDARAQAAIAQAAMRPGGPSAQPALLTAQAARDQAALNLARTTVRAPAAGLVSQSDDLQVGTEAVANVPLLTIVRNGTSYVVANYKETQLADMRVGQPAVVKLDAYPGVRFSGHVASIGAGTGSQFSVLPAQNATGNWVKVSQRVPVRVAVDGGAGDRMIAGLSATVTVDTRPASSAPRR